MTDREAIRYCRDLGWFVEEVIFYPYRPTGVYKFRLMRGFASDYSTYIDTNLGSFADAAVRIASDYVKEDDRYRASGRYKDMDAYTRETTERVRHAMDELLETMWLHDSDSNTIAENA